MTDRNRQFFIFTGFLMMMVLFLLWNPFPSINFLLEDMLFQHKGTPSDKIFVIGIDEKSLNALGPWNSWPRSRMAEMIRLLNADESRRPAVIGIDVMYFGETAHDRELFDAAAACDNLVFASELQFSTSLQRAKKGSYLLDPMTIQGISLPQPPLDILAESGFTNVFLDSDGAVRRSMLSASFGGMLCDSFPAAVYNKYAQTASLPAASVHTDAEGMWTIPYTAAPGVYQQGVSFVDVLEGKIPPSFFQDGIVLIGSCASGMMDSYHVPISKNQPMYGVEINANMIQALLNGNSMSTIPVWLQIVTSALLFCLCYALYRHEQALIRNMCLLLSTAGWWAFAGVCSRFGFLWNVLYFPLFSLLFYAVKTLLDSLAEHRDRLLTMDTFERYVSPEVAKHLLVSRKDPLSAMKESRRHIAVMFVDIRNFTPLSESLEADTVADILNEYLTLTSAAVFQNGGTVDKFIGDATMAIFNAPANLDDYIYRAVKTAQDIADGSDALNQSIKEKYGKEIRFGIGIHCGEAVVGSIGAPFRMDYTAIGDTVNTAARLESIAAPGQILVSEDICLALAGRIHTNSLGARQLKGKAVPFRIFEVVSLL